MFIKQRQVRRSARFSSRWSQASRKRREYVASLYTTAVIQAVLFVFLVIAALRSYRMMVEQFPDAVLAFRLGVPLGIAAVAFIVLRVLLGNIKRGVEAYRKPRPPQKTNFRQ